MTTPRVSLARVTEVLRARSLLEEVLGSEDADVFGVSQDSRDVSPGDLFLCWRGVARDGHDFAVDAERAGAVAVVVERELEGVSIPQIVVREGRLAGALAADVVMGSPWREMRMVGITGTNGKTTTALILRHLLTAIEGGVGPAAAIGTLGIVDVDGEVRPGTGGLTTPGPVLIARWLRVLANDGVRSIVMETSSHGLEQKRLDAVGFDIAVFTNLSRDHLDYHGTVEAYRDAKLHLVDLVQADGVLVLNADEPAWTDVLHSETEAGPVRRSFGIETDADVRAFNVECGAQESRFQLEVQGQTASVRLPLIGLHNVENATAAAAAALSLGVDLERIAEALGGIPQIPGRLERVISSPATVFIDFAHTPDAIQHALETLRPLTSGRLIIVFGAGGDRDPGKREAMGRAAAAGADYVVLTSDNPRTEDPDKILDDITPGLEGVQHERVVDRRVAIARALDFAESGDVVLLAGKGHESYQVIGTTSAPFDEREIVRECVAL